MWDELLRKALLGTDRTDLSISLMAELQALGIDTDEPPEKVLANGLAYYRVLQKVALDLPVYTGTLPEVIREDDTIMCSPKSSRHLQLILDGTFAQALPEFIQLLQVHNRRLPPESIPRLLDRCVADSELWSNLHTVMGELGRWLIAQNPRWQKLMPKAIPENWLHADLEQRSNIVHYWRQTQPGAAIEALNSLWDALEHKEKVVYLKKLQVGLSSLDESFLEKCLDDSRKPVRLLAAELLVQLPDSAIQERLFAAAATMIRYEDGRLKFDLPTAISPALLRDGIEKQQSDYMQVNQRLGWFLQIVERIAPSRWERYFDQEAEALLSLAREADKTKNFIRALSRAALLHREASWLAAIAHHWSVEQDEGMWMSPLGKEVLAGLSDQAANTLAIRYLERNEYLIDERSLVNQLLRLGMHKWENRLAVLIVKGFQNWLSGTQTVYGNLWHYKELLTIAAYGCSPYLAPQFQTGWHASSRLWGIWQGEVEQFLRVLYFRKEFREELSEEDGR